MRQARRGFTFLELMVVMVIMAMLAAFTIPNLKGPNEFNKLRAGAREIASLTRYARSSAIMNEAQVPLLLDARRNRYRLNLDFVAKKKNPLEEAAIKKQEEATWRYLPKGVSFSEVDSWDDPDTTKDIAQIIFYADGSASDSRIILVNDMNKNMTIQIQRATAQAEVIRGLPGQDGGDQPASSPAGQGGQ